MPLILSTSIKVALPVWGIDQPRQPVHCQIPLSTQIITAPYKWAQPLWDDIQPHMHMDQLQTAILENQWILLVNDATVHHNGHATCTWVIWAGTQLWSGEGHNPAQSPICTQGKQKHMGWQWSSCNSINTHCYTLSPSIASAGHNYTVITKGWLIVSTIQKSNSIHVIQ